MIAVDPGINACGVAEFTLGQLIRAQLVVNSAPAVLPPLTRALCMAQAIYPMKGSPKWVIELPQMGTYGPARQKDLVLLWAVGACLAGRVNAPLVVCTPHEWKGSIDGDAMVERIKDRLTRAEIERVELPAARSKAHNVWDAIGIGLWCLGRLARKRVIAR